MLLLLLPVIFVASCKLFKNNWLWLAVQSEAMKQIFSVQMGLLTGGL